MMICCRWLSQSNEEEEEEDLSLHIRQWVRGFFFFFFFFRPIPCETGTSKKKQHGCFGHVIIIIGASSVVVTWGLLL